MPAHTAVASHSDAIYSISAGLPATYDEAGYSNVAMVYTPIGKVSKFMPYGAERSINKFPLIRGAAEKTKGSVDYGDGDLMCGDVPADPGQVILKAAEASPNHYSLKIEYPDGEEHYLDVIVASWKLSEGAEGAAMVRTAKLGICRKPVEVAAT